ncbi:hypothetical protein PTSG_00439 [Salpingoeca rosetta]|uniref:PH domain-containing protein n=1 Tax=Salpingoeca rosetta (strain ATCC 50818 / BSB-021) TaxID=946362 RepID=F2TWH3_SALR5|nr:uncharacterized protein PTSG_00439 [Salpingoeca rosetta]EGD72419.1 hypothetical protein PTSG_00439 [Salpingoeca rosetta]|eukprot:XP_004998988.1 hypothetical protein PTSG_00439 [Salpingoeca rosetta]
MREALVASYVVKQGQIHRAWRRRWMCLYRDGVIEYQVDMGRPIRGRIDMRDVKEIVRGKDCADKAWPHAAPKWPRFCSQNTMFALITEHRTYYLYTFTPRDAFAWIAQLERTQFDLVNEASSCKPRTFSVSIADVKDVRIPAYLPEDVAHDMTLALERPSAHISCCRATFTATPSMLATTITETGVLHGQETPVDAATTHVLYRRDCSPIMAVTLTALATTFEGINFAGVLTVTHKDQPEPIRVYLPGMFTYDPAGATGTQHDESVSEEHARVHMHIVAAEMAAILQHASLEDINKLHASFDSLVRECTGRPLLHMWMHHQLVSAFIHGKHPQSYAEFIAATIAERPADRGVNLQDPSHAHTTAYLASRTDSDAQAPPQFFAALVHNGMRLAQLVGLAQFRLLQRMAEPESMEELKSCNPAPAALVGADALRAALMLCTIHEAEKLRCCWRVDPASTTQSRTRDSPTQDAATAESEAPGDGNDGDAKAKRGGEVGGVVGADNSSAKVTVGSGSTMHVRVRATALEDDDVVRADATVSVNVRPQPATASSEPATVAPPFHLRDDVSVSFSREGVQCEGIGFAGSITVRRADNGPPRVVLVPGVRTYDIAGKTGGTRASERVGEADVRFLSSVIVCELVAALHSATAAELDVMSAAFAEMNTAFHGRPTLAAWLHNQVVRSMCGAEHATTSTHDTKVTDAEHSADMTEAASYALFLRSTRDVSQLSPQAHLTAYLASLDAGSPQPPLAFLATCFRAENLGKVLPLAQARLLETLVREMDEQGETA